MRRSRRLLLLKLRMLGLDICRLGRVGFHHARVRQSANPRVRLCRHLRIARASLRFLRSQRICRTRILVMVVLVPVVPVVVVVVMGVLVVLGVLV